MKKSILSLFLIAHISGYSQNQTFTQAPRAWFTSLCTNGEDAYLASGAPTTNYGTHPSLGGNTWTCNGDLCLSRALFRFDLSSIPAGAVITNASLQLYADLNWSSSPTTGGPNNSGILSRVTATWTENTVTWNTQPSTSAANQLSIPASTSTVQDYTLNVTTLVQDILATTNYGFMLRMQDELNFYKSLMFASSDNAATNKCPQLNVQFIIPSAIDPYQSHTASLHLYPNPFTNEIRVSGTNSMERAVIADLYGRMVKAELLAGAIEHTITTDDLLPGLYIVSIYDQEHRLLAVQKMVK